jgi:Periplasmic copper-binding protein (NosD)
MNEKIISLCRYAILVTSICFAAQSSQAATVVVGNCRTGKSFTSIQAAVDAAPSGSTIDVCPGTYPEQVMIEAKTLTLVGVLSGTNDAAVLVPPAGGLIVNGTRIGGRAVAAQIFVQDSTGVTISHLTVDGNGNALIGCLTNPIGIYFKNSSGRIIDSVARNHILESSDQGCQVGLGIAVESNLGNPAVTISNNSVHNYQKNGITAGGPGTGGGPAMAITNNTVAGIGATPLIAQNGIQIGFGAIGKVTGNTVADDIYSGPAAAAGTGILIFATTGITISGNSVQSTQFGIATVTDSVDGPADNAIITSNHIGGTQEFDAIDLCSSGNTVQSNNINGGQTESGIHLDDQCPGPGSTTSGVNNSVANNTLNEPCAGILLGSSAPNTVGPNTFLNVTHTTLAGNSCPAAAAAASKLAALSEIHSSTRRPSPLTAQ